VFDGVKKDPYTELDKPSPINDYGMCKMEVEGMVLNSAGLVIRTVGVFGNDPKNFMTQVLSIKAYDSLHVPDDQYLNPIWGQDLG
jgi:dTDP-4-dehydrorhamnose reductase